MEIISSRNNPKIKRIRALKERKARQTSGLTLVEGIFPVGEAAAARAKGVRIETIVYAPSLLKSVFASGLVEQLAAQGVVCLAVSAEVFASLADKENPQGILAVVRPAHYDLEHLNPTNAAWCVALVSPQDPGNVGSIIRTMDAVGASALLLLNSDLDPYHPGMVRASMGTGLWMPIVATGFESFVRWARQHAYTIYGTSAHGVQDYLRQDYRTPCVLLLGSEREGLSADQRAACNALVRLPMRGRATSLNLAVACGVMLYTMLEKLTAQGKGK